MSDSPPASSIGTYRLHEGELTLPPGWRDQSMQVFRLPGEAGQGDASFIVTRDYETPLAVPAEYARAQQETLAKQFGGYRLLSATDATLDGDPAAVVDYQWLSSGVLLRQRQAYFHCGDCMVSLTLTARATRFEQLEGTWGQVMTSFRLRRKPESDGAPGGASPPPGAPGGSGGRR